MDAPLGEARELYRLTLEGSVGDVEIETEVAAVTMSVAELAAVGAGSATLSVRQLGDFATSQPATLTINLN